MSVEADQSIQDFKLNILNISKKVINIIFLFELLGLIFSSIVDYEHSSFAIFLLDVLGGIAISLCFLLKAKQIISPNLALASSIIVVMLLFIAGFVDYALNWPEQIVSSYFFSILLTLIFGLLSGMLINAKAVLFLGFFATLYLTLSGVFINQAFVNANLPFLISIASGSTLVLAQYRRKVDEMILQITKERQAVEKALEKLKIAQKQIIKQENLAALGTLVAGISHELRNPLNFVNNFSEISSDLLQELSLEIKKCLEGKEVPKKEKILETLEELQVNLKDIAIHGKRGSMIIHNMLMHNRSDYTKTEAVHFNSLVTEAANLALQGYRAREHLFNLQLKSDLFDGPDTIPLIEHEINRVVLNLCANAFYAVHQKSLSLEENAYTPTVYLKTSRVMESKNLVWFELSVRDNGPGFDPKVLDQLFKPFFTTKPPGEGTGLGLSMAYEIITQGHNGSLEARNAPEGGAEFIIRLPLLITPELE